MSRKCLWRVHRRRPADSAVLEEYRNARRNCRQLINEYEARRETAVVNADNLGKFYRCVNKRLHCKSRVGVLYDCKGNRTVASDQEKANLLNNYFASVGVVDDGKPLDVSSTTSRSIKLDSIAGTLKMREMENAGNEVGFMPSDHWNRTQSQTCRVVNVVAGR